MILENCVLSVVCMFGGRVKMFVSFSGYKVCESLWISMYNVWKELQFGFQYALGRIFYFPVKGLR